MIRPRPAVLLLALALPVPLAAQTAPGPAPASKPAAASARQTLAPQGAGENSDVESVTLQPKPAAILPGTTSWEAAAANLKASFATIEAGLARAGLRATGKPLAVFVKTEESGFQYEAMIPVEAAPTSPPTGLPEGLRFGTTPAGKALRFKHTGSYEEISGTYDTLIAYFDAKDIAVQDRFIEEYVSDLGEGGEEALDVNIYALLK